MQGTEIMPSAKFSLIQPSNVLNFLNWKVNNNNIYAFQYAHKNIANSIFESYFENKLKNSVQLIITPISDYHNSFI